MPSQDNEQNALNRRHFLRISALGSLALHPAVSWAGRFIGQRDAFSGNFLGLIGAYAPGTTGLTGFGPKGIHLRWLFPLERGFPNFFRVYRRAAFNPLLSKNIIPGISGDGNAFKQTSSAMPFVLNVDTQSSLTVSSDTLVNKNPAAERYATFDFSRPLRRLQIEVACDRDVKVHAYSSQGQLIQETYPAGTKIINLLHEGIERLTIELTFSSIRSIACTETSTLVNDKSWQLISPVDLRVFDSSNSALPDFTSNLNEIGRNSNFFQRGTTYRSRLSSLAPTYRKLLEALKQAEMRVPSADTIFKDPFKPAHELELRVNENVTQQGFYPLQWLLWASTDPNIARLMQLYFIDSKAAEGTNYAYKVEAHYAGNLVLSGVIDNIMAKPAASNPTRFAFKSIDNLGVNGMESVPAEPQIMTSGTIPADQFSSRATARIYLTKRVDASDFNDSMFLLLRRNENGVLRELANKRPIYPTEEALAGIKPTYTDYGLPPDVNCSYIANGIDLFGVYQSDVESGSITASDTLAPPPPRKLNTVQRDGKTFLQYMYGGPEYLAGPDIKSFDLHTSATIHHSVSQKFVNFNVAGRAFVTNAKGQRIYTLQCKGLEKLTGLPVNGTLQITHDANGDLLPPSRRIRFHNYKLSQHSDKTVLVRVTTEIPGLELPATGILTLAAAADDPTFWGNVKSNMAFAPPTGFRLTGARSYNQPGTLGNADAAFTCKVVHRRVITQELGVDRITGRKQRNQTVVELYLDRPLRESGIFKGAAVGTDLSITTPILEQFSGPVITSDQITQLNTKPSTQVHCARIWVIASSALTINSTLRFFPTLPQLNLEGGIVQVANPTQGMMRLLLNNAANPIMKTASLNGGEIFVWGRYLRANPGTTSTQFNTETIPLSLELLSDVYALGNGNFEALVQCPKAILDLVPNQKARFFPLSEWDISSLLGDGVPGSSGRLDTYFAIRSRDAKNNAGRMSKAMQVVQLRPRPTTAGPMPRFCGTAQGTDQQAPLPDQSNHAMVCLEWDNAGTGIRYEIARASGSAIINQHRALWYLKPSGFNLNELLSDVNVASAEPVAVSRRLLSNAPPGIHLLRISSGNLNNLAGGRIIQNGTFIYQIIQIQASTATTADILVKATSHRDRIPISQPLGNTLDREPPYHLIQTDSAKLRRLADLSNTEDVRQVMEQAFALLHSTALHTPGFTDRMPASGTDRFFYKVRVVDAAENRGPWSPAGGALLQLDMRAPEAPTYLSAFALHREAMFVLPRKVLPASGDLPLRWKLERSQGNSILSNHSKVIEAGQLQAKTYFASGRMMVISQPEQLRIALGSNPADDLAFIRSNIQLNRLVTGNNNPVPIATESYYIGFNIIQSATGNQRLAEINSIRFLDPQDGRDRFTIRLGTQTFSEEPAYACFPDALPAQNDSFTFNIQAAKSIGGNQFIPSAKATLKVDSLDLSRPNATVTRVNTDVNGSVSAQPASPYTTQLRIASAVGLTVQISKTLRSPNKAIITRFSPNAAGTGAFPSEERVTLQPVNGQITLNDLQLNQPSSGIYDYQLIIRGLNEVPMLPIAL